MSRKQLKFCSLGSWAGWRKKFSLTSSRISHFIQNDRLSLYILTTWCNSSKSSPSVLTVLLKSRALLSSNNFQGGMSIRLHFLSLKVMNGCLTASLSHEVKVVPLKKQQLSFVRHQHSFVAGWLFQWQILVVEYKHQTKSCFKIEQDLTPEHLPLHYNSGHAALSWRNPPKWQNLPYF